MTAHEIARETTESYDLIKPARATAPMVVDSPHSWRDYPEGFEPACTKEDLLTSWDAWVDELFGAAPEVGAPLLRARFPRYFIDPNRARDDIDPDMVSGTLPFPLNPTRKSEKGFGLLRRNALPDVLVYENPVPADILLENIQTYYDTYHAKLGQLIADATHVFGRCLHLDCHSMKSVGNAMNDDAGAVRPDVVVSDNFGKTANPAITHMIAEKFNDVGLKAQINDPYKGAELINRHGAPSKNRHSVQLELNRALYMNEATFEKSKGFATLKQELDKILKVICNEI